MTLRDDLAVLRAVRDMAALAVRIVGRPNGDRDHSMRADEDAAPDDQPEGRWLSLDEMRAMASANYAAGRSDRLASAGARPAAWAGRTRGGDR